jgi:hypothetical protein
VVNIWDCGEDGWEGWRRNLDRLNLKRRNAFYGDWWDEASQWRAGGYDRVCAGVPGSPTTAEIAERGIRGSLFVNEVLTVRHGTQAEFLAADRDRLPVCVVRIRFSLRCTAPYWLMPLGGYKCHGTNAQWAMK